MSLSDSAWISRLGNPPVMMQANTPPQPWNPWPTAPSPTATMAAHASTRKEAELKCEPILDNWNKAELALLFHIMTKLGWTRDDAKSELQKAGWWLY